MGHTYINANRHTMNAKGNVMHTDTDRATYWQTLSNITGRSVRYLKVRAVVRMAWPTALLSALFAYALTK